jgi:CheY-like chemotaxis protein
MELSAQTGISEVLRKPVSSHEIARAVRKVLDANRSNAIRETKT